MRGVQNEMELRTPPLAARTPDSPALEYLPHSLEKAVERFKAPSSVAREVLDFEFVDFFTISREHELRLHREAVSDW